MPLIATFSSYFAARFFGAFFAAFAIVIKIVFCIYNIYIRLIKKMYLCNKYKAPYKRGGHFAEWFVPVTAE